MLLDAKVDYKNQRLVLVNCYFLLNVALVNGGSLPFFFAFSRDCYFLLNVALPMVTLDASDLLRSYCYFLLNVAWRFDLYAVCALYNQVSCPIAIFF